MVTPVNSPAEQNLDYIITICQLVKTLQIHLQWYIFELSWTCLTFHPKLISCNHVDLWHWHTSRNIMINASVFFFLQQCRTAITVTRASIAQSCELSGHKRITTDWCSIITEIADKQTKKKPLAKKQDYCRWQSWSNVINTTKVTRSAGTQLPVRRREERGRHNSRFLRVCLPAVRGKHCGISIRRCAHMTKTSHKCLFECISLRDCRNVTSINPVIWALRTHTVWWSICCCMYICNRLSTKLQEFTRHNNEPKTCIRVKLFTINEPTSWFSSGERDNNNTSAKSSWRINNNSGATC